MSVGQQFWKELCDQERIEAQKNDLVWLRLTLAAGPVNL